MSLRPHLTTVLISFQNKTLRLYGLSWCIVPSPLRNIRVWFLFLMSYLAFKLSYNCIKYITKTRYALGFFRVRNSVLAPSLALDVVLVNSLCSVRNNFFINGKIDRYQCTLSPCFDLKNRLSMHNKQQKNQRYTPLSVACLRLPPFTHLKYCQFF